MQTVSSGWAGAVAGSYRQIGTGTLVSWNRLPASGINFFTVGTSKIGGQDIIKSGGTFVTFFDKYGYTDYSQYALDWSVSRQTGQYPFGLVMAQADVRFDNTSKLFTPSYDATIGSGILPNRPMKLSVSVNNESLMQFVGFTGQPELSIADRSMTLHAYDVMDYLNNFSFTASGNTTISGFLQNVRTDQAISYYLTQLGFTTNQFSLDQSLQPPIGFVTVTDRKFGDVLKDLIEAEQATMFADENGIIRFWNRQHFLTTSGNGNKFAFNYNNITQIEYQNAPVINDVEVIAKPRKVGTSQPIFTLPAPVLVNGGSTLDVFATFSDNYGALPVTFVTTPTVGVGASSYFTVNTASDGTGTNLSSFVTVQSTYLFGTTYRVTFQNNYSSGAYITALQLYGTPAKITAVINQRYLDQSSIDNHGRNPMNNGDVLSIENSYIQDASTANALAWTIVDEFKTPRRRYVMSVFANPALQIGDYGTVTIPETGETKQMYIVGITTKLSPFGDLMQELQVEERQINSYLTVGVSLIGGTDRVSP